MKTKNIIAFGVTATVILAIMLNRFIRLLKGEQIIYFLARIGDLKDISLMSLLNIGFVALFTFFKRVRLQAHVYIGPGSDRHEENRTIFLHSSYVIKVDSNEKSQRQAA